MALYVEDERFLPSLCDKKTGRRTDVKIPFRTNIPETSLVFLNDVRCICPDATHMLTRCVESDLRKMAQKIINDKSPFEMEFLHRFEQNLSSRDAKRPVFQFKRTAKNALQVGTVGAVSLSGSGALTVIADKEELKVC